MNKKELISSIAERTGVTKKDSGEVLDVILDVITEQMILGNEIKISGFGLFKIYKQPERECRNPKTGEKLTVGAKKVPKFKFSQNVKTIVNGDK